MQIFHAVFIFDAHFGVDLTEIFRISAETPKKIACDEYLKSKGGIFCVVCTAQADSNEKNGRRILGGIGADFHTEYTQTPCEYALIQLRYSRQLILFPVLCLAVGANVHGCISAPFSYELKYAHRCTSICLQLHVEFCMDLRHAPLDSICKEVYIQAPCTELCCVYDHSVHWDVCKGMCT